MPSGSSRSAVPIIRKIASILVIPLMGLVAAVAAVIPMRLSAGTVSARITAALVSSGLVASGLIWPLRAVLITALAAGAVLITTSILSAGIILAAALIHAGIASRSTSCRLSVIVFCMSSTTAALDSLRIILFCWIFV